MKVGLYQLDGKLPSLALMKLSTYWRRRGAEVALNPSRPGDLNFASVIFASNFRKAVTLKQAIPNLEVGGTGWDWRVRLPEEVESCPPDYDLYGIDYGLGRLTVGCFRRCPWCLSWKMEPQVRTANDIGDIINRRSNFIVLLDDNILHCWLFVRIIRQLELSVNFNQGLDIRLVDGEVAGELARVDYWNFHRTKRQFHFAFDSLSYEGSVRRGVRELRKRGVLPSRLSFYMLIGYGHESFEEEFERLNILRGLGVDAFAMPYRDPDGRICLTGKEKHLARWVNRRYYKVCPWEEYEPWKKARGQVEAQGVLL